jgi:3-oxoadipate enol-lactonase
MQMGLASLPHAEIYYHETGRGETVIFIPGLGADHSFWLPMIHRLHQSFHCVAVDNRGSGRSSAPPGPYTMREMAADVLGVADHLQADAFHVVGISLGGAVAQELALLAGDRVKSLSLLSTWAKSDEFLKHMVTCWAEIRETSKNLFNKQSLLWLVSPAFFTAHKNTLLQWMTERHAFVMTDAAYRAQVDADITHDASDRLSALRVPTQIIHGELDICIPLRHAHQLHQLIPQSVLHVLPGSGHVVTMECPDEVASLLDTFLREHAAK